MKKFGFMWLMRIVLLGAVLLRIHAAESPGASISLSESDRTRIKVLAAYVNDGHKAIDPILGGLGFDSGIDEKIWRAFPSVRKLETAYIAAENGKAGSGIHLLHAVTNELAKDNAAMRSEASLVSLFNMPASPDATFIFARGPPDATVELGAEIRKVIGVISDYCYGSAMSGPRQILIRDFNLPEDKVYDILRRSDSVENALATGLSLLHEDQRYAALMEVLSRLTSEYSQMELRLAEAEMRSALARSRRNPFGDVPRWPGPVEILLTEPGISKAEVTSRIRILDDYKGSKSSLVRFLRMEKAAALIDSHRADLGGLVPEKPPPKPVPAPAPRIERNVHHVTDTLHSADSVRLIRWIGAGIVALIGLVAAFRRSS